METSDCFKITLPIPPSVNQCFGTNWSTKRRFKSKKYEEWIELCNILLINRRIRLKGDSWLAAEYKFYMPIYNKNNTKKVKDVANYEKALSDYLSLKVDGFEDHKLKTIFMTKIESDRMEVELIVREISTVI